MRDESTLWKERHGTSDDTSECELVDPIFISASAKLHLTLYSLTYSLINLPSLLIDPLLFKEIQQICSFFCY